MRRRDLIAGLLLAGATPRAWAQTPERVYRIATVSVAMPLADLTEKTSSSRTIRALFEELRRRGYFEGRNLVVKPYSGEGRGRYTELAEEMVRAKPDLIFAYTGFMAKALATADPTVPVVAIMADPVAAGVVTSLAHPGGNVTGVTVDPGIETFGKRLELLREMLPTVSKVGYLAPRPMWENAIGRATQAAADRLGLLLLGPPLEYPVNGMEVQRVFAALAEQGADAIYVIEAGENSPHRQLILELAAKYRLPAIYGERAFVNFGGLMAYAIDYAIMGRHAAGQIDDILKGAKPADIPIYQPIDLKLIINLKAAKALGLTVPPSILTRADEVIE